MANSAKRDPNGTWHIQYRYTDWTGKKRKSSKKGFRTKKEAEEWLAHFLLQQASDPSMTLKDFWEIYIEDMSKRLKPTTIENKQHIFRCKIQPYFGDTPINEINAAKIRKWQCEMMEKGYTGVLDVDGNLSKDAQVAQEILDKYARDFQERNPNLYLFNAVLHMDEATPHLHLDYIPVAHGYKTKMHTRNSLTKALQETGIESAISKLDNETMHWQAREREYLMELCQERALDVEILGEVRDNYTIHEYKVARQAADELIADIEILNSERKEIEASIDSMNSEASGFHNELEESRHQLEEINAEIEEREKCCEVYQKKIDKIVDAERTVKKELDIIRTRSKTSTAIWGSEKLVKVSEKDFEKLMTMAQASGTLKKLHEAYDNDMNHMQGKINKLSSQVQTLKEKLSKAETFINIQGLIEEFTEYLKSSSIMSRLKKKQKLVDENKRVRPKNQIKYNHEI